MKKAALAALAVAVVLSPAVAPSSGAALDEAAETKIITDLLVDRIQEGYIAKDSGRILAAYADEAEIHGYFFSGDRAGWGRSIDRDLARFDKYPVRVTVENVTYNDGEATVSMFLSMDGTSTGGRNIVRNDHFFLLMRKSGAKWLIYKQSPRADFTHPTVHTWD